MKSVFIPVVAGLKKMMLTGSIIGLVAGTTQQAPAPETRLETCIVYSQNELIDCNGDIWYIEDQNLPAGKMATTLYLKDGTREIMLSNNSNFWEQLLLEKLGDDAASLFREFIAGKQEDIKVAEFAAQEQEQAADGYLQMCRDAMENFNAVLDLLNAPRLNRKSITQTVRLGYDELYNNL